MTAPPGDHWSSGSAYESYVGRWSRRVAPRFLEWLDVPADRRWLDVGCGTGALTQAIVDRCQPESVIGVDPSATFLEHARALVPDPRATFVQGSAAQTGVVDAAADAVVSGLVLNFVPDVAAAMAEALRVAAPGAIVAGYVWDYADGMQFLRRFWDAAVALDRAAEPLDEAVRFPLARPDPLRAAFTVAGLAGVEVRSIEVPTEFADFEELWRPFLGGTAPGPAYVASLDERGREALRERYQAAVGADPDGRIRLSARAWAVRGRRAAA